MTPDGSTRGESPPNPTSALGVLYQGLNLRSPNSTHTRKERPLIGPWNEVAVEKHTVALIACPLLKRQRDQVAEATLGQRVLVRKQVIVGIEPDVGSALHRFGQQVGAQASHQRGRPRVVKEQPHMPAPSGPRSLEGRCDSQSAAGSQERGGVILPSRFIEIDCEEETGLIEQQRVHTSDERLPFRITSGRGARGRA